MSMDAIENMRAGTFLMDQCGSEAHYQGCLRITPPTHSRGDITQHFCFVGGIPIPVAKTRGVPTAFTFNVEAPFHIILGWYHRRCPFTLAVAIKACQEGWEIAQWDDGIDYVIYYPDSEITDEGLLTNVTQGLNDISEPLMGTVSVSAPDWEFFEKHSPGKLAADAAMSGTIEHIAYCGGPLCASLSSACNQPYDPGCEDIWLGGDSGFLWVSVDGGLNWTNKEGTGTGQLDLDDPLYGTMDVLALLCDRNVVLVSAEDGCIYYSHDGGTTWYTPSDCSQMAVAFAQHGKTIWAAGAGLWKSVDDGVSWTQVLAGTFVDVHFDEDGNGVAITATLTYFSNNEGANWVQLGSSGLSSQADVQKVNGIIWVSGGDGMAYTRDQGQNWTVVNTDAWDDMLWLSCNVGYRVTGAGNTVGPLQYTLDGGVTWFDLDINGYVNEDLVVLAACYDRLMIGGASEFIAQMITKSRMIP
jgi:hypothetical protein